MRKNKVEIKDDVLPGCAIILAIAISIMLVSFFFNAGLVALVCAAFGFQFTWLKATAIWFLLGLASSTVSITMTE